MRKPWKLAALMAASLAPFAHAADSFPQSLLSDSTRPAVVDSGVVKLVSLDEAEVVLPTEGDYVETEESVWGADTLLCNSVVFGGVETYKGPLDTSFVNPPANGLPAVGSGFTSNAGLVTGLNTSAPVFGNVRAQVGGSFGAFDLRGRDVGNVRQQNENLAFFTAGFYQRADVLNAEALSWGVVYDGFWVENAGFNGTGDFHTSRLRGLVSYSLNPNHEFGVWGAVGVSEDAVSTPNGNLRAVNQANAFYQYNFDLGGSAMFYVGALDQNTACDWTSGLQLTAPLADRLGLYVNSSFMFPSAEAGSFGSNTMQWSLSGGLSFYFGGKARLNNATGFNTMPLFNVANTANFQSATSRIGN